MTQLVRYEQARTALAAAHRVDEVKEIRDKAEAMAAYARQAKDSELIQFATEIKVRAERRCGELLSTASDRAKAGDNLKRGPNVPKSHDGTSGTLADIGLTKNDSSRFQALAAMPAEHFETAVATAKASAGEVTTAFMLREARKLTPPDPAEIAREQAAARVRATKERVKAAKLAEAEAAAKDAHGEVDLAEELEAANKEIDVLTAELQSAEADDTKAEILKLRRLYDNAQREQSKYMELCAQGRRREEWVMRQLMRCGKAVGETDPEKIAPTVEAIVRPVQQAGRAGRPALS